MSSFAVMRFFQFEMFHIAIFKFCTVNRCTSVTWHCGLKNTVPYSLKRIPVFQLYVIRLPGRHVLEEVKKVSEGGEVPVGQHAGQQHGGRGLLLLAGELLGLEKGLLQLRGQHGLRELPEELLDQAGHVAGESCGQALLAGNQFGLSRQNKVLLCPRLFLGEVGVGGVKSSQWGQGQPHASLTLRAFRRTTEPDFLNRPSVSTWASSFMHASTRKL